jgi:small subunit ribosomal protein S17
MLKIKRGIVVSCKMNKTIIVAVENKYSHDIYRKTLKKTKRFMTHDEKNECKLGDNVEIFQVRPISRSKRWSLKYIIKKEEIIN